MWWVAGINPDGSPQLVNVVGLLCGALLLFLLLAWVLCAMLLGASAGTLVFLLGLLALCVNACALFAKPLPPLPPELEAHLGARLFDRSRRGYQPTEAGALVMPFAFRGLDRFNRTDTAEIVPGVVELVFTPAIDAGAYEMSGLRTVLKRARVQTLCALGEGAEPDAVTGTVSGAAAETSAGGDAQRPGGDAHLP
jgi:hypothetical protein